MLKFFRKHNKKLIALFMGLLMIVFIGGSALESLFTPDVNPQIAKSALGDISFRDRAQAAQTTMILGRMGIDWKQISGGGAKPITEMDWVLLTREAQRFGIQTDAVAARAWAKRRLGLDREGLTLFSRALRAKPSVIVAAIGNLASIQVASDAVASASTPSTAEVRSIARRVFDQVLINAVMLPAGAFVDEEEPFPEAQLQAHWEKYREIAPGPGLNFGYYLPPAAKVQYVKIDRDTIAERVGVANLTRKARRYYDKNRDTGGAFRRPADEQGETGEQGIEGPQLPPYLLWEEAEEIAVKAVRAQYAKEVIERIASWMIEQASDGWVAQERGEDGYRQAAPELSDAGVYRQLIERLPPSLAYPQGITIAESDFFFADQAATVPDIGVAAFRPPRAAPISFTRLAFQTKDVVPEIPTEEGTNRDEYTARFQTGPYSLSDFDGNYYLFRVIDHKPAHAAESVAEVRDRVIADLRTLQGYETARARAEGLRSCTPGISLQEAFESDQELLEIRDTPKGLGCGFFEPSLVARLSRNDAMSGRAYDPDRKTFVPPDLGMIPAEVVEQWFELELAEAKTAVFELKDRATVVIAEWVETQIGTQDDFDKEQERFVSQLSSLRSREALGDWLDPEKIRARNSFELVE